MIGEHQERDHQMRFEGCVRDYCTHVAFRERVRQDDDRGLRGSNGLNSGIPG